MSEVIDICGILKRLPHRFPFVMIDRVVSCSAEELVAIKNVTYNEPYFVGHFPEKPVMPAVLQLEAMAQAAAVCQVERSGPLDGKVFLFTHVKNAKFSRPVTPGDVLTVRATITRFGSRFAAYSCSCSVGDIKVAEAEIMATVADASSI